MVTLRATFRFEGMTGWVWSATELWIKTRATADPLRGMTTKKDKCNCEGERQCKKISVTRRSWGRRGWAF